MFGGVFFDSIVPKIHQFNANLFYRGQKIDFLERADFETLEYWSSFHDTLVKEEKPKLKKKKKDGKK